MKQLHFLLSFLLVSIFVSGLFAQTYQGPAPGSLPSGITQTISALEKSSPIETKPFVHIRPEYNEKPSYMNFGQSRPEGSNYVRNTSAFDKVQSSGPDFLLNSFNGINYTNSIPPDCNIAAGPTHVIATVNSSFSIWDKEGKFIKNMNGTTWASASVNNPNVVCDPKIVYDHFDKRWVLVWLTVDQGTQQSFWTVSVSDDSIPLGTWYTWATPSNLNGSTNAYNYGDYEGLGFDKDCIYITGNQFGFTTGFNYSKLRIIPKAQLYANTAGAITWNDIWDIRVPGASSIQTFGIRPSVIFGNTSESYLVWGNRSGADYFSVYKINNPLTSSPSLTGFNVPVTYYTNAPDVNQLGGSYLNGTQYLIDGGSSQIRNEPVYRDGNLWVAHSVRNPENPTHSALHYVRIDVTTQTALEDVVYGDTAHWYSYPAVMVDKDKNMTLAYSRSAYSEYIGAFYSTRRFGDPPGLSGSKPLAVGNGNYVVIFNDVRNRWGDYTGIALDPSDEYGVWMLAEFAASTAKWGTYVGNVLAGPKPGVIAHTSSDVLNFEPVEVSKTSDTLSVRIYNIGAQSLTIQSIALGNDPFHLLTNLSYPISIATFDTLTLKFTFNPVVAGDFEQNVTITSNSGSPISLKLVARGYTVSTASANTLYASTGTHQLGGVHIINRETGVGTLVGTPTLPEIKSIALDPKTKVLYGIAPDGANTNILVINAALGDAYKIFTIPVADMGAIAFDTTGDFYAATNVQQKPGVLYKINLLTKAYTELCTTKTSILSMSFNPANNELWAVSNVLFGTKDKIFKINTSTGDTINVGRTGLNTNTNAIGFDDAVLFGTTGSSSLVSKLIKINTTTGAATQVGETGIKEITGLTFSDFRVVGVRDEEVTPSTFRLAQNYPNPFNPSTVIEYSLPKASNITLIIYNILGQKISELVNTFQQAGTYKLNWNAVNNSGVKLTSGIYFYEMKANSVTGDEFVQMKKMILIK